MNNRLLQIRAEQCRQLAQSSHCVRRKVAALLLDPVRNQILVDGYNGGPRGGSRLCGSDTICRRDAYCIPSGERTEIGCHHAEQNAVANAAYLGVSLRGAWLLCTTAPCLACARLIHHAGIARVVCVDPTQPYLGDGRDYLVEHGVEVLDISPEP